MSPNPVDLEETLTTLRSELPPPAMGERALAALRRKRTPRPYRSLVFLAAGVAVAGFAFYPRARAGGSAFGWVLRQTASAPLVHVTIRDSHGEINGENWSASDKKMAYWTNDQKGNLLMEMRRDSRREFLYLRRRPGRNPNAEAFASVTAAPQVPLPYLGRNLFSDILKLPHLKVLSHERQEIKGIPIELYRVSPQWGSPFAVKVDPQTDRVLEIEAQGYSQTYEYPDQIDPAEFEPRAHRGETVRVHDIEAEGASIEATMKRGIAKQGRTTLRLVALDNDGNLWVLWTGYRPDGAMTRPFNVPGVPLGRAYGLGQFTSSARLYENKPPFGLTKLHLSGMARTPKVKIGDTVDVEVPTETSYVSFRNVPVMRLAGIMDYALYLRGGK